MSYDTNKAFLSDKSYGLNRSNKGQTIAGPNGSHWFIADVSRETQTGYQGFLLKNVETGKYELVSRGTQFEVSREGLRDAAADLQMGLGQLPDQVSDARVFLKNAQDYILERGGNPNTDLSLTGHSLGGSITQVLGAENPQLKATTFNAYGTGNLIPEGSHPNITNHVSSSDSVSSMPGSNMPGETLCYESKGGHGIGQFIDANLGNQGGVHVTINMPPVKGIDSDPMGAGDGAAIMNAAEGASSRGDVAQRIAPVGTTVTDPNHSADYNFPDTAGAGRGVVNPVAGTPNNPDKTTVFNASTALGNYTGDNAVTVLPGDTVASIAKRYDMTVGEFSGYLKDQYGPNADLNSIVAGHKLPLPPAVYERTLGGINGLDLPADNLTLQPEAKEVHDAVVDAFKQADQAAADLKAQYPGVQVAEAGGVSQILRDVEDDGYLESTQWVAASDSSGHLQALLTIDFDRDGIVQTHDILSANDEFFRSAA